MMQQRINLDLEVRQEQTVPIDRPAPLRIDVFTSEYCTFCGEALQAAKSAACRLAYLTNPVEVRERPVDNQPGLIEKMNIIALPMIQVGRSRVIGLPSPEDIERLVNENVLTG